MQYNTYLYIFSINKLQFIGHLKLCIFIGRKKEKKIIQNKNRALFNMIIILPLSNLTYAFDAQDNESPAWSYWAAGWCVCIYIYIYINIYMYSVYIICTLLVYTIDTVPLGYRSICHNRMFVRILMVYQYIFNLNSKG